MPNASRVRSSSAATAWSPRRMLPASEESVSASAVALAARRDSRSERSTMVATVTATTAKTARASTLLVSPMVNVWIGGMK